MTDPSEAHDPSKKQVCLSVRHLIAGLLLSSQFPVNYFSISDVEQFYPDFASEYSKFDKVLAGEGKFWRFNRIHDYAGKARLYPTLPVHTQRPPFHAVDSLCTSDFYENLTCGHTCAGQGHRRHVQPVLGAGQSQRMSMLGARMLHRALDLQCVVFATPRFARSFAKSRVLVQCMACACTVRKNPTS